jgi:hypothetical protein
LYLIHLLTKVWILCRISRATRHVSHPHNGTDFTQELKILIYLGYKPNLAAMSAADQMLGNYAWKMTFLFVIAVLHSAEVPEWFGG